MPKPYIYTEGEPVGKYGATFLQEIDPLLYYRKKSLPVATVYFKEGHWQI